MRKIKFSVNKYLLVLVMLLALALPLGMTSILSAQSPSPSTAPTPDNPIIILATTTSTQDSGLLDVLLPEFEKQTGYMVRTIAVGSGAAMTMGERGEADVILVHAPMSELSFMAAGHGVDRKLVMHNDFIIVGPENDPAGIRGMTSAVDALKKIAESQSLFISRGDNSGTDQLEKSLWQQAGIEVQGQSWYQETGQGMGATLTVASEKQGYTISDRATYLARQDTISLVLLVEDDPVLLDVYHVITVNPDKSPQINTEGAQAFANFMVDPATQAMIGEFGVEEWGEPLFFPDADKTDEELGLPTALPSPTATPQASPTAVPTP
jgi:tungstate transport system substrate-binding protein